MKKLITLVYIGIISSTQVVGQKPFSMPELKSSSPSSQTDTLITKVTYTYWHNYIKKSSSKVLPEDLKDEVIVFLKFDSVNIPAKRPKEYDKASYYRAKSHNEDLPKYNRELRKSAAKYPFKYKIVSMTDGDHNMHGARYLLWFNSFDGFNKDEVPRLIGGSFQGFGQNATYVGGGGTRLGLVDLKTGQTYLISEGMSEYFTYHYSVLIEKLIKKINKDAK